MSGSTITILIADDHALVRAGLRATFEREGLEVAGEASTAGETLRLACGPAGDVLLLDIRWAGTDPPGWEIRGIELLERIHSARPQLPILMYSVVDSPNVIARCRELGATGYLVKGQDEFLLLRAIYAACDGRETWPSRSVQPASPHDVRRHARDLSSRD
jgi:DNA-binding NarL/FixJ family response regulator